MEAIPIKEQYYLGKVLALRQDPRKRYMDSYCNITALMPDLFGNSRLKIELDAWKKFVESLSPDNKELLQKAIENSMQYADFAEIAARGHETEALLLGVLLAQQKKIEELKRFLDRRNNNGTKS